MNMKKIFKYILLSALTIAAVASCEDDRNNFLPEDSFGFNNPGPKVRFEGANGPEVNRKELIRKAKEQ